MLKLFSDIYKHFAAISHILLLITAAVYDFRISYIQKCLYTNFCTFVCYEMISPVLVKTLVWIAHQIYSIHTSVCNVEQNWYGLYASEYVYVWDSLTL